MPHDLPPEQVTRNWDELLQELRVVQTGVQILTGFLLTVPFSDRFTDLDHLQVTVYLCVLGGAVLTTGFVMAPVAFHRLVFRQGRRLWLVEAANQAARVGLLLLALTSSGVILLVFDVALDTTAGLVGFGVALLFFSVLWAGVPLATTHGTDPGDEAGQVG